MAPDEALFRSHWEFIRTGKPNQEFMDSERKLNQGFLARNTLPRLETINYTDNDNSEYIVTDGKRWRNYNEELLVLI